MPRRSGRGLVRDIDGRSDFPFPISTHLRTTPWIYISQYCDKRPHLEYQEFPIPVQGIPVHVYESKAPESKTLTISNTRTSVVKCRREGPRFLDLQTHDCESPESKRGMRLKFLLTSCKAHHVLVSERINTESYRNPNESQFKGRKPALHRTPPRYCQPLSETWFL